MPSYHFNIYAEGEKPDLRGKELPDIGAARREGSRIAGELLRDDHEKFWTEHDWRMEVTDENGLVLLRIDVLTSNSAAVKGS